MKINGWSVVKSPIGVSLRRMKSKGEVDMCGEICVAFADGGFCISVYADGVDPAVSSMFVPQEVLQPVVRTRKRGKK